MTTVLQRKAGTTDVSVVIRIIDSGDGTPETGVTSATGGIDLEYRREGAAVVNITEADLSALTDAHSDGGMLHISGGYYRLDLPDAAVTTGATGVLVAGTITGMVVIGCYVQLVAYDPFDTVRLGLTALPNAAADAAGGLPISDAGGLDLDAILADTADMQPKLGTPAGASISADILTIDNLVDDLESRIGTPSNLGSGATVAANLVDIEGQTDDIGTAGAGLTAVPWNAAWDAEVQSEVDDALVAQNLDHLVKIAVDTDFSTTVHLDSVIGQLADNGTTATFDRTTDSQEAIRDRGDAAWITASPPSAATIADAVWDEAQADHVGVGTFGIVASEVADILTDTAEIGAAGAGLTNINLPDQTMNITGNLSGSVGSVTGAVGSVTSGVTVTTNNDKTGYALSSAGVQAIWDALTSALTAVGSIGKLIVDNLNATISSRSSHSAADVWAAGTRTLTAIDEDTTTLDLDATVRAAVGMASANLDTQLGDLPTAIENADALLNRDLSTGTDSGTATVRTPRQALRFLRNKWAVSGTTLTVYKEDDTTSSWTATVSTDAAADPITGNDPASS